MSSTHLNTLGFRDKVKWTLETCLATVCSWTTEIISALCSQVKNSHCFSLPEEKNSLSPLPTKTQLLASHKIDYFWNICFMCRFLLLILFFVFLVFSFYYCYFHCVTWLVREGRIKGQGKVRETTASKISFSSSCICGKGRQVEKLHPASQLPIVWEWATVTQYQPRVPEVEQAQGDLLKLIQWFSIQ